MLYGTRERRDWHNGRPLFPAETPGARVVHRVEWARQRRACSFEPDLDKDKLEKQRRRRIKRATSKKAAENGGGAAGAENGAPATRSSPPPPAPIGRIARDFEALRRNYYVLSTGKPPPGTEDDEDDAGEEEQEEQEQEETKAGAAVDEEDEDFAEGRVQSTRSSRASSSRQSRASSSGRPREASAAAATMEEEPEEDAVDAAEMAPDAYEEEEAAADADADANAATARASPTEDILRGVFDLLDRNGDGKITKRELMAAARDNHAVRAMLGASERLHPLLRPATYKATFEALDTNHDGAIQYDELEAFCRGGEKARAASVAAEAAHASGEIQMGAEEIAMPIAERFSWDALTSIAMGVKKLARKAEHAVEHAIIGSDDEDADDGPPPVPPRPDEEEDTAAEGNGNGAPLPPPPPPPRRPASSRRLVRADPAAESLTPYDEPVHAVDTVPAAGSEDPAPPPAADADEVTRHHAGSAADDAPYHHILDADEQACLHRAFTAIDWMGEGSVTLRELQVALMHNKSVAEDLAENGGVLALLTEGRDEATALFVEDAHRADGREWTQDDLVSAHEFFCLVGRWKAEKDICHVRG